MILFLMNEKLRVSGAFFLPKFYDLNSALKFVIAK